MEIRILQEAEAANAAGLSRYVFDTCLRNRMEFPQTIAYIEEYLTAANLRQKLQEGRLVLWGVYEAEHLVAVSGLQTDGLITMLYVLPQCMKRGFGKKLLNAMRSYAKDVLGLTQLVVNATPAWTSTYFATQGFVYDDRNMHVPFMTMRAKTQTDISFEKKPVPAKVIVGMALGCVVFATIATIAFLIWYTM